MAIQRSSSRGARLMAALIVLALLLATAGGPHPARANGGIIPLTPGSITFNRTITFNARTPGNYDGSLAYPGISFAELFVGKSVIPVTGPGGGVFDFPVGDATSPLTRQPGASGQNLALVDFNSTNGNALGGIGLRGFPIGNGEGMVVAQFDVDQAAFGFEVRGGHGGPAQVNAFGRDGQLLGAAAFPAVDGSKVFKRADGAADIAGILLFNFDLGGLFFDNFGFSEPVGLEADMELVEKKESRDPVLVGTSLTYTITLRNNGPHPATGVRFSDFVHRDQMETAVASSPNGDCTVKRDIFWFIVRCPDLGTLEVGGTATVVITVVPKTTGTLRNRNAEVRANETDPNPANNTNDRNPTVTPVVNVDVYITAVVNPLVAGLVGDAADDLTEGQAKALFATLRAARDAFLRGDYGAARQQIMAFRTQVDTVGMHLPAEEREALKQEADLMLQSMDFQGLR